MLIYLAIPISSTLDKEPSDSVISRPTLDGISSMERPDVRTSASASSVKDKWLEIRYFILSVSNLLNIINVFVVYSNSLTIWEISSDFYPDRQWTVDPEFLEGRIDTLCVQMEIFLPSKQAFYLINNECLKLI